MTEVISDEKLIVKVDSQIVSAMGLCPERYRLEHVEHWRPFDKAKALERGSVLHHMVKIYRLGKMSGVDVKQHAALVEQCILKGRVAASATNHIDVQMFEEEDVPTFKDYILKWQYDGWEILEVERPFTKQLYEDDIPIVLKGAVYPGLIILYEGVIDAYVKDPRIGKVVVDTKTESRKSYPYILSNQFQGYEWGFGVPVIVDKVGYQSSLPSNEKFRRLEHRSGEHAIAEWREDVISLIKVAIGWHNILHEGGRLRKERTSCDKYSGCIYQKVCQVPEESRAYKLQAFFFKDEAWDPYSRDDELEETEE